MRIRKLVVCAVIMGMVLFLAIPASIALAAAPTVTSITPNQGNNGRTVNITDLAGTGFVDGAAVKLYRPGSGGVTGPNQVVNPGFESYTSGWPSVVFDGWVHTGSLIAQLYPPFVHGGLVSGQISSSGNYIESADFININPAIPGTLTAWFYGLPGSPADTLKLEAQCYDSGDVYLSSVEWTSNGIENWQEIGGAISWPANTTKIKVRLTYAQGHTLCCADDVSFTQASAATYTITPSAGPNGTISPATPQVVDEGGSQTFNFTPDPGYHIADVLVDGISVGAVAGYTFGNVTDNHTIAVTFAANPVPPPVDPLATWYLAEGSTNWGFSTYIAIENPNNVAVTASVTYLTTDGPVSGGDVYLPSFSQATINPADKLGGSDFSTKVECVEGMQIAVDRTMTWNAGAGEEAHNSVGVTAPAKTWYLPEGSSKWGFECFLLIQNPSGTAANVTLTYMIEGESPKAVPVSVPANSRATYNMAEHIGAKDASIKVVSNTPVIPERAMYRNSRREGHDSIGTTTPAKDYYLAEGTTGYGFTTYVLVQNPNDTPADIDVTYMTGAGPVNVPTFQMPAQSRKTINVNATATLPDPNFSTKVHGSQPIIAERAMYWNNGTGEACHDSIGMSAPHATFYLPDGETSNGRETWTLVQNPNATAVNVEITYMTPTGEGNKTLTDSIPANSRKSFSMADAIPDGRAAIMVTSKTTGKKFMVERAMYWNSRGAGTDTIGWYGD